MIVRRTQLTVPKRRQLVKDYLCGHRMEYLVATYGIGRRSVYNILKESGITPNRKYKNVAENLRGYIERGMTRIQLSALTGYSETYLYKILRGTKRCKQSS